MRHIEQYFSYANVCFMKPGFKFNVNTSPAFISASFKDGGRQHRYHNISNITLPRTTTFTLLVSLVDGDIKGRVLDIHPYNNSRHF